MGWKTVHSGHQLCLISRIWLVSAYDGLWVIRMVQNEEILEKLASLSGLAQIMLYAEKEHLKLLNHV